MYREDTSGFWDRYNEIFDSESKKAEAFDKIARNYYQGNFGSMQKSDIDVLMFSLFIEGILDKSENDISSYSDYTLAKQLGITQSRVSNLKQKKQLQYPYKKFDWRVSLERCCENARADGGKIKINLRDINLYYELKNQIDEFGGYVETSLTRNLLIISPKDFFRLIEQIMSDEERSQLENQIKEKYSANKELVDSLDKESLSESIKNQFKDNIPEFLMDVLSGLAPGAFGTAVKILRTAIASYLQSK